jgi:acylphosphatase
VKLIFRRYRITGRVQGVGFRYQVAMKARSIGVTGYAHNKADGSVEVYAEGTVEQLAALHAYLVDGPSFSRVDGLEFSESGTGSRANRDFSTG